MAINILSGPTTANYAVRTITYAAATELTGATLTTVDGTINCKPGSLALKDKGDITAYRLKDDGVWYDFDGNAAPSAEEE